MRRTPSAPIRWLILCSTAFLVNTALLGQIAPPIAWQNTYGGSQDEVPRNLVRTADHGFVVAGFTTSNDGDVSGNNGSYDMWAFKIDSMGTLVWQRALGGVSWDDAYDMAQAADGGFFLAGIITPYPVLFSQLAVSKLDSAGNEEWSVALGGSDNENARGICGTSDGGCIIAGTTESNDGDVSGNHGLTDLWVVKLDAAGAIEWQHCYGGSDHDNGWSILQTDDGGYLCTGMTLSTDGDVTANQGSSDVWLLKLDSGGAVEWQNTYGGTWSESGRDLMITSDGGILFAAETTSSDGDVTGQHGDQDMWIVKLDALGDLEWQKCLGGTGQDIPIDIDQLADGGFILNGNTRSVDGDVIGNHGWMDAWVARLDATGDLLWQKTMGGSDFDGGCGIEALPDDHFMMAGYAQSNNGDVQNFIGVRDVWMVELGEADVTTGVPQATSVADISALPNPTDGLVWIAGDIGANTSYVVINSLGAVVLNGRLHAGQRAVDLGALPPGPYALNGTSEEGSFSVRVVKE